MTVSWAVDIVIMELLPEDGEALINVLMSMASRQEGELDLLEVAQIDKLAQKAQGVHILVLTATVIHLEVEHRGLIARLLHDLVDVVPEVGEDDIGTFAVNWPVGPELTKLLTMVEDATDLWRQAV
jgi:hypothetical protein